jgi:hypothetical protein
MNNHYEVPELVEIGRAQDVILGFTKGPIYPDSPSQIFREIEDEDDE